MRWFLDPLQRGLTTEIVNFSSEAVQALSDTHNTQDSVACGRIVEAGRKWDSTERAGPHAANHLGPIRWI